ncbi:hypothetical protein [Cellulomonas shaoxiangyii]|uniref:Uncharacterized protein n=1 Tax=Cellulomonas shaoxiangyii TaxID=2566013 RepID=A0A4P7SJU6_9CELL|nr:hypothetical protein [Cellulomonas shaoxiangyii]QCB92984.1 hypothetical protein E5225_04835 [Cellulomonas shaoxiangyii]TGY84129.1 hypothetical protein E5226_11590 [Cellulomonas shaoxiangyii]
MSTDDTRPLPADETRPLPVDETRPLPVDEPVSGTADDPQRAPAADRAHDGTADGATATGTTGRPARDRARVGTIVWGVVIALLGAGVLAIAAGYTIDLELAAIALLILAGLGLIIGPLVANARRGRGDEPGGVRG